VNFFTVYLPLILSLLSYFFSLKIFTYHSTLPLSPSLISSLISFIHLLSIIKISLSLVLSFYSSTISVCQFTFLSFKPPSFFPLTCSNSLLKSLFTNLISILYHLSLSPSAVSLYHSTSFFLSFNNLYISFDHSIL